MNRGHLVIVLVAQPRPPLLLFVPEVAYLVALARPELVCFEKSFLSTIGRSYMVLVAFDFVRLNVMLDSVTPLSIV